MGGYCGFYGIYRKLVLKLYFVKVFFSEGGYYGFYGINGKVNLNEIVRDFFSSDGYDGFYGICGKMIN